ncbi:MAG: glycosyltransferase family 4 protein [Flavobacteriales bacterium]|nr:glycosyltransferase family 4 protein [Flavobacteriales bacterium]
MRTLLVTNMYPSRQLPYSGVFVKAQYKLLTELAEPGEHFDIFFMRQVISSRVGSYFKYILAYLRFIPVLFRRYDVLHVHFYGILAPAAILYRFFHPRTKLLLTLHGGDVNDDLPEHGLKNRLYRKWIKKFDRILPVGHSLHEPLLRKLGARPDFTLCAGVDKRIFFTKNHPVKEIDFLVVGSFLPVKGLDVLIDAFPHLKNKQARFCFVGNGPLEKEVRQLQKNYNVELAGNKTQDELRELYWKSKFLLFPSRGDAFGLVVTEAIFCGTPAIVWAHGGAQYQIRNGHNGFIFEDHTPLGIAQQLNTCMDLTDEAYDEIASYTARTNAEFSLQNVCNTFLNMYRKLCSEELRGMEYTTNS